MNVSAYHDKEKTGKRKAGEERRQETDFKEAACCLSAVVQGTYGEKMVCVGGVPGVTGTSGSPTAILTQGYLELRDVKPRDQRFFSPSIVGLPATDRETCLLVSDSTWQCVLVVR